MNGTATTPVPLFAPEAGGIDNATLSNSSECDPLSQGEIELYMTLSWWFEGLLQGLVGTVGFLANALAVPVLCSREMNSIFNRLLVFLSLWDNLYIVCSVLEGVRKHTAFSQAHEYAFGSFLYQLHNFVLCCSIYTTLALALERYRAVWRPVEYHNKCKGANPWRRVAGYVVPVCVFSAVFNIPKFLEVEFVVKTHLRNDSITDEVVEVNRTVASPTDLRLNDTYVILYVNAARLLVQGIIPFVLLTILNYRIYWVIKRRREMINRPAVIPSTVANTLSVSNANNSNSARPSTPQPRMAPPKISPAQRKANETQQAVVLFFIVLLFFICHTPRFVLNVHEFLTLESLRKSIDHDCNDISLWALVCASVSHFLMTLNSSVNFFIYCFMCATFRRLLFRLVFRKFLGGIVVFICTCGRGAGDDAEGSVRWRPRWVPNAITRLTAGSPSPADGGTDLNMEENSRFLTTSPAERRRASSNAALQRSPQAVTTVLPSPNTVITMRNGEDGEIEIRRSRQASSSSGGEGGGGSSESSSSSTGQQEQDAGGDGGGGDKRVDSPSPAAAAACPCSAEEKEARSEKLPQSETGVKRGEVEVEAEGRPPPLCDPHVSGLGGRGTQKKRTPEGEEGEAAQMEEVIPNSAPNGEKWEEEAKTNSKFRRKEEGEEGEWRQLGRGGDDNECDGGYKKVAPRDKNEDSGGGAKIESSEGGGVLFPAGVPPQSESPGIPLPHTGNESQDLEGKSGKGESTSLPTSSSSSSSASASASSTAAPCLNQGSGKKSRSKKGFRARFSTTSEEEEEEDTDARDGSEKKKRGKNKKIHHMSNGRQTVLIREDIDVKSPLPLQHSLRELCAQVAPEKSDSRTWEQENNEKDKKRKDAKRPPRRRVQIQVACQDNDVDEKTKSNGDGEGPNEGTLENGEKKKILETSL